jgi:hypothetical protein
MASSKKAAKKGGSKKGASASDGFTAGEENENIRDISAGVRKRPKTAELPTMEGHQRKIPDLHDCAEEYVEIRDARMELNAREIKLKDKLKGLMKKHKKELYECDGVKIELIHIDEEEIKVKAPKKAAAD